jgi:hypothetical protein
MRNFFMALGNAPAPLRIDFWGQSNQVGAAGTAAQAPTPDGTKCKKYVFTTASLVAHVEPSGQAYGSFQAGSGLQAACLKKLNELTGRPIISFKCSRGGTGALDWANSYSVEALGYLAASPANVKNIQAVLHYFQGEADAVAIIQGTETKAQFKSYVQTTISRWRAVHGAAAKVFLTKVGNTTYDVDAGTTTVNQGLQELADTMTNVFIAFDASALDPNVNKPFQDKQHFNQTGLNAIGEGSAITIASHL